jgi:hypothetical protein
VGLRHSLDAVAKRKIPAPFGNRTPVFQPVMKYCRLSINKFLIIQKGKDLKAEEVRTCRKGLTLERDAVSTPRIKPPACSSHSD